MSKKSHHFLTLWPWPLTYDLEKLIRSGHYHYQCVYQIWDQSIPWFLSYRVNTIADTGDIISSLTPWGRVKNICVANLTIIGSDNGLSPDQCQAITWTNAGILLIGPLGTIFSEMLNKINTFSFNKLHFKTSSAKQRPFFLGLNVSRAQLLRQVMA